MATRLEQIYAAVLSHSNLGGFSTQLSTGYSGDAVARATVEREPRVKKLADTSDRVDLLTEARLRRTSACSMVARN